VDAAAGLSASLDRAPELGWKPGSILLASLPGADAFGVSVAEIGSDIELRATFRTKMSQPDLEKSRDRVGKRMEDTPLRLLAPSVQSANVQIAKGGATIVVRAQAATVGDAMQVIVALPPGELKRIFAYVLAPESNEEKM
jgi:hypothetical protein